MTDLIARLEAATGGKTPHMAIWHVLHEVCGAPPDMPNGFVFNWPECREYRFMGALGTGGKIWSNDGRWYVTNYPETSNAERDAMIAKANERLAALKAREANDG